MVIQMGHEPAGSTRRRARQGKAIRQVRLMRRLASADLADQCGVTAGAVSQWETGRHTPRPDMQVRIAQVLDVPWSMLFGLDSEVNP